MFFAAMLHSQFVPHIVATCPKTGNAALSCLCPHCGHNHCPITLAKLEVMIGLWSHRMFFAVATMPQNWPHPLCCTHSLCRTLWPLCPKTGSVLAMQFLCRSHGWTVVNHYYTQNWGLTVCFLRLDCGKSLLLCAEMLHSQFVPHIVATMPQNWLGLGHAVFVQKS